eukprot:TRINITY_DN455_c0_g1_i1.p1 TRINITY_DN455_c0_g1~~TRINITY_DN455_c0_g1_i1.p1  ORF type:complete len:385 (+),score=107.29 TRINITY_DN455_c0_g1_i1:68-1222(+)
MGYYELFYPGKQPEIQSIIFFILVILYELLLYFYYRSSWFTILCYLVVGLFLTKKIGKGGVCRKHSNRDLTGKTILITGANSGLGKATAEILANFNGKIIFACRNKGRGEEALEDVYKKLKKRNSNYKKENLELRILNLGSLKDVKKFVDEWKEDGDRSIDILINNAGCLGLPYSETVDEIESTFAINHMGPFLLTLLLLKNINRVNGRIVNLSSIAHSWVHNVEKVDWKKLWNECKFTTKSFDPSLAYGISKLANVYFTRHLHKLLFEYKLKYKNESGATTYVVHPGVVVTNIARNIIKNDTLRPYLQSPALLFMKTPSEGSQTTIYCATHPDALSGNYYADCKIHPISDEAQNDEQAERLFSSSMSLCSDYLQIDSFDELLE